MNDVKTPRNQKVWKNYKLNGEIIFVETSNKTRDMYYLYRVEKDNTLTRIESSHQPIFKEVKKWIKS